MKRMLVAFVLGAFALVATPSQAQPVTWDVPLRNGWNLIAIPIEPADPAVGVVFADLIAQGAFQSLWSYDATTGEWSAFVSGSTVPGLPAITQVETGRGYWIQVTGMPTPPPLTITGADPLVPAASLSELELNWNLISSSADEAKPYDRVFEGVPVLEIWTFDSQGGVFEGVVLSPTGTGPPTREDFTDLQPEQGYWVLIDPMQAGPVSFGPDLDTSMAGDVDVMPLLPPAPGPGMSLPWPVMNAGDEDIGGDGLYDSPLTQRAITFRDFSLLQSMTLLNSGSGVLSYTATIDHQSPLCGGVPNASLEWLSFREEDPLTGELFDLPTISGSVATESATLTLAVNRAELTPGTYCAAVAIATNSVSGDVDDAPRTVLAYVEIPTLEGDYEIVAQIDTIDGKAADTAAPSFFMSLYSDASGPKAILDGGRTLLLPQQVRMTGDVYQDDTNRFILSGSFTLPASDPANPYDTELRRDITFVARRQERSDPPGRGFGPLDLVGEYGETIRGPLGDDNPIYLSGTLRGRRVDPEPSVLDGELSQSAVIQAIPDGGTTEYMLVVTEPVLITDITVMLDLTHPSPTDLWIRLEPPPALGVAELTLRRASDRPLGAISFEETETAVDDLQVLSGLISTGTWTLRVEDEMINGQTGQVNSAGLEVSGTRVVGISGTVAGVGAGADVLLTGCGLSLTTTTSAPALPPVFTDDAGDTTAAQGAVQAPWNVGAAGGNFGPGVYQTAPDYLNNTCAYLTLPPIALGTSNTLDFWSRYEIENSWDKGEVQISTDGGANWSRLEMDYPGTSVAAVDACGLGTGQFFTGTNTNWERYSADLTAFDGQTVEIRFAMSSDNIFSFPGWFVDDIQITNPASFQFDNLIDCAYRITVQADGFEPQTMDVVIGPNAPDAVVAFNPVAGPPLPDTNVPLPCEDDGMGSCTGLRFQSLNTVAGAGAYLPTRPALRYVMDAGTFDLDRPPLAVVGPEDTVLFSVAENPVTLTNACVTPFDSMAPGSTCIEPGDGIVDPPVGTNSARAILAIGGPVIGTSVSGSHQLSIGANP